MRSERTAGTYQQTGAGRIMATHPLTYPRQHDEALAELLDAFSARRVAELIDLPTCRVLEVGAGGGRFARYLADRVGPRRRVYPVDSHPRIEVSHPPLTAVQAAA